MGVISLVLSGVARVDLVWVSAVTRCTLEKQKSYIGLEGLRAVLAGCV